MVSSGQKGGDLLFFTSETPHFFKIILEDTVREGKLVIPRNFMKNYGGFLGNLVYLRVPSGAVWQVELARDNANACLHKGWNEFAEYFSLACGHFLVFELRVRSEFRVLIFDKSATEIKYPYYSTVSSEEPVLDGERKGPDIERYYMEDDSFEPTSERSPLKPPQPHKKKRNEPTSATGNDSASNSRRFVAQCSGSKAGTCTFSGENIGSGTGRQISAGRRRMRTLTSEEKAQAFQRASAFKSQHPYFMIAMQPRSVDRYELGIPIDFARNHLGVEHSEVILCGPDGRTWPVDYHCYPYLSRPKAAIGNGWKEFVLGNGLKIGDVCVFELRRTSGTRLNVFIF